LPIIFYYPFDLCSWLVCAGIEAAVSEWRSHWWEAEFELSISCSSFGSVRMKSWSVDEWREYFVSANSDIFEIIENAIVVAATDCPKEFRVKRDAIAERLFCSRLTRCAGCDRVELVARGVGKESDDEGCKNGVERNGAEFAGASKESKVNEGGDEDAEIDVNGVSNYSFGEAEALTDEMDEETQYMGEILRIKDVLLNREEEVCPTLNPSHSSLSFLCDFIFVWGALCFLTNVAFVGCHFGFSLKVWVFSESSSFLVVTVWFCLIWIVEEASADGANRGFS